MPGIGAVEPPPALAENDQAAGDRHVNLRRGGRLTGTKADETGRLSAVISLTEAAIQDTQKEEEEAEVASAKRRTAHPVAEPEKSS